jgi:hypothetical protein
MEMKMNGHHHQQQLSCGPSFFLILPAKKMQSAVNQQQHWVSGHSLCVSYGAFENIVVFSCLSRRRL